MVGAELGELVPGDTSTITFVAEKNLLQKYLKGLAILQPHRPVISMEAGRALLNGHVKLFSKLNHA